MTEVRSRNVNFRGKVGVGECWKIVVEKLFKHCPKKDSDIIQIFAVASLAKRHSTKTKDQSDPLAYKSTVTFLEPIWESFDFIRVISINEDHTASLYQVPQHRTHCQQLFILVIIILFLTPAEN